MKTFYIIYKGGGTQFSEGRNIREALARLGLTLADVKEWHTIAPLHR